MPLRHKKVERENLNAVLKRSKGLWREKGYPNLKTIDDIARLVADLRKKDFKRKQWQSII